MKSCSFARTFEDPCARGGAEDATKDDDDGDISSARRASPGSPLRRFSRTIGSSVAPDASSACVASTGAAGGNGGNCRTPCSVDGVVPPAVLALVTERVAEAVGGKANAEVEVV